MPRGGRHRRGSRSLRGQAAADSGASACTPAAQPTPLADVSNSARPAAAPPLKRAAASPAPPAAPSPLPGLEEDGLPAEPRGRLPVAEGAFEAFGDALGCLRVTSLTRSASARRHSLLRLVQQPGEAEGRRSHSLPPEARPLLRAQTQPLPDGGAAARHRGRRGSSAAGGPAQQESSNVAACLALQQEDAGHDSSQQPPPAGDAASSPRASSTCSDTPAPPSAADTTAGGSSGHNQAAAPTILPPPLPVMPGAVGVAAATGSSVAEAAASKEAEGRQEEKEEEQAAGSGRAAAGQLRGDEAVFCGLSAAEEAGALPSEEPPPAWLTHQGCSNVTSEHVKPCPALSVQAQQAAAVWRAQWLSGLQWHNAVRAGAPLRTGSKLLFIPVDPNNPVLEVLMFRAAVMPQDVVAGAARFQDIVLSEPELLSQALEEGVLRYGLWGVPCGSGSYTLVAGGSQLALPLSFRRASPEMVALFLACVWTEANSHETAQALAYSFGAGGERALDESLLKYPASELHEWLHLAAGGTRPTAVTAALAALRRIAVFGTQ